MIDAYMNGEPYRVARFAATLRRQLYKGTPTLQAFFSTSLNNLQSTLV